MNDCVPQRISRSTEPRGEPYTRLLPFPFLCRPSCITACRPPSTDHSPESLGQSSKTIAFSQTFTFVLVRRTNPSEHLHRSCRFLALASLVPFGKLLTRDDFLAGNTFGPCPIPHSRSSQPPPRRVSHQEDFVRPRLLQALPHCILNLGCSIGRTIMVHGLVMLATQGTMKVDFWSFQFGSGGRLFQNY